MSFRNKEIVSKVSVASKPDIVLREEREQGRRSKALSPEP